jgi:hypothetical protein
MNDPLFEISASDWWITFYIRNTFEMYLHAWVPLAFIGLVILAGVSSKIKSKRKQPKPLLGVVPPRG